MDPKQWIQGALMDSGFIPYASWLSIIISGKEIFNNIANQCEHQKLEDWPYPLQCPPSKSCPPMDLYSCLSQWFASFLLALDLPLKNSFLLSLHRFQCLSPSLTQFHSLQYAVPAWWQDSCCSNGLWWPDSPVISSQLLSWSNSFAPSWSELTGSSKQGFPAKEAAGFPKVFSYCQQRLLGSLSLFHLHNSFFSVMRLQLPHCKYF